MWGAQRPRRSRPPTGARALCLPSNSSREPESAYSMHAHSRAGCGHRLGAGLRSLGACMVAFSDADQDDPRPAGLWPEVVDSGRRPPSPLASWLALCHAPLMSMTGSKVAVRAAAHREEHCLVLVAQRAAVHPVAPQQCSAAAQPVQDLTAQLSEAGWHMQPWTTTSRQQSRLCYVVSDIATA